MGILYISFYSCRFFMTVTSNRNGFVHLDVYLSVFFKHVDECCCSEPQNCHC
jgi:hypothetical protein